MNDDREQLQQDFFAHTKAIQFRQGLEGQRLEDGVVLVGDRAGPETRVTNLCHEMAHFCEIDDDRMTLPGWGLRVPQIVVCGQVCVEPTTLQITEREMRVAAYQANLHRYLGLRDGISSIVRSFTFLPDFMLVPLENGQHPYAEGKPSGLTPRQVDASRLKWIENRTRDLMRVFTIDRFIEEWHRKIKLLA